ncbi:hypothetical protein BKA82DRAFT_4340960 [Pisolithus tinctorius]|nr:hypothetical protein BKA82DRAFT_4340960 [Pisolithus tinctorius]
MYRWVTQGAAVTSLTNVLVIILALETDNALHRTAEYISEVTSQRLEGSRDPCLAFQGVVELMMAGANLSWEEAIEALEQHWAQDNLLDEQQQEGQPCQEEEHRLPLPPVQPPVTDPKHPHQQAPETNPPNFNVDTIVSTNLPIYQSDQLNMPSRR